MVLINGVQRTSLDITDRGLQYGDGVFETIRVQQGIPLYLSKHIQRLLDGCRQLFIRFSDQVVLNREIKTLSASIQHGIVKIIVTRGTGGRGYRCPEQTKPTRILSTHPIPDYPVEAFTRGVRVRVCETRLSENPYLAGIKHLNRLEQIIARNEWNAAEISEGLVLDTHANVVEGTMSNLFCVKNGRLYSPAIDRCGVKGVMRSVVIELARAHNIIVDIGRITLDEVKNSDELFLTNSVIELWPVSWLEDTCFNVGPITAKIKNWLGIEKSRILCV